MYCEILASLPACPPRTSIPSRASFAKDARAPSPLGSGDLVCLLLRFLMDLDVWVFAFEKGKQASGRRRPAGRGHFGALSLCLVILTSARGVRC